MKKIFLLGLFAVTALLLFSCTQPPREEEQQPAEAVQTEAPQVDDQTSKKLEELGIRVRELQDSFLIAEKNIANLQEEAKLIPITTKDESKTAKETLKNFFDYLRKNEFEKATGLYDNDFPLMKEYTPIEEGDNKAKVLENYCKNIGTCLEVKILETKRATNFEYSMVVQFIKDDGTFYIYGPCCGATEEQMPSTDKFDYTVRKINGEFKVTTPPLYRP